MATTLNAQDWIDKNLYPFENKFVQLKAGNMHYVDEGEGEIILFIHGTPTWSFLYRDLIQELSGSNRCIAIDHIGFGLSEKSQDFADTPQAHSKNLVEFIEKLNLKNITLVVHDFGGPIGLGAAIENPDNIKQVILFNTWLWETKSDKSVQKISKILNSGLGRFMYLNLNFSPKVLLKKGFSDKKNLPKTVHKQYLNPFSTWQSRHALLNLGRSLAGSSDWYERLWSRLDSLAAKPWLILWGKQDNFISTEYLNKWKERLTTATVKEFECGHFVQEEKTQESIIAIRDFLKDQEL